MEYLSENAAAYNADELDRGLKEIAAGIRHSILTIGIGLARIKTGKLFEELGYRTMTAYMDNFGRETGMDPHTIYTWHKIGEVYMNHEDELKEIGFTENDGLTKLPFLERALAVADKKQAFSNLKSMSQRQFAKFAREKAANTGENEKFYERKGNIFFHKGKRAIIINTSLGNEVQEMLISAIIIAFKALQKNSSVVAVHLKNEIESIIFMKKVVPLREKIQKALAKRKLTRQELKEEKNKKSKIYTQ